MRRVIAALAAGGLLVGAAFTAGLVNQGGAIAQEAPGVEADARPEPGAVFNEVLDGLVADGTLTRAQADAVAEAFAAKREELHVDHGGRRHRHARFAFRLGGFLEDGVIDADELDELPEGHPLTDLDGPAADYLEDGQITEDEWRELRSELRENRRAARAAGTDA